MTAHMRSCGRAAQPVTIFDSGSGHDLHTIGESISELTRNLPKQTKGGTGEETESLTLNRIETMMSELSRMMEAYEHRSENAS